MKECAWNRHCTSGHCHRRGGRHSARRAERGGVLGEREERPLQHQRRHAGPLGSGALLRSRSEGARQDLLEDRRLGARVGVGSAEVGAADPAAGQRRDGRRAEVGGRLHAARRSPTTATRNARSIPSAPPSSSATPWPARSTTSPRCASTSPSTRRSWPRRRASRRCRRRCGAAITAEMHAGVGKRLPEITEDTMPGELSNCIAGRIANLFNFRGPNYVVDAACASAMAAISAAVEGLDRRRLRRRRSPAASTATWARRRSSSSARSARSRPPARGPTPTVRTASSWARGRSSSCSSAWPTPSATATRSTPCCAASAARATARARASPRPTRSASGWRSSAPGRTPGCRPRRRRWSKATARRPASATWSRSQSLAERLRRSWRCAGDRSRSAR